jgi:nucleoid-associated protein YgaU
LDVFGFGDRSALVLPKPFEFAQMSCGVLRLRANSCKPKGATMGLLSFIKEAGEKLFSNGTAQTAMAQAQADPASVEKSKAANDAAADAILAYIDGQGLRATGLTVTFDGATATATVYGVAPDQMTKEKIILCCGNVSGVVAVNDQMTVDQSQPEAQYYTVVRGDTLSKISKQYYGDPNKYNVIFEANKPMLKSPDRIYPGQMLRIPTQ